jgi:hypothetical protein
VLEDRWSSTRECWRGKRVLSLLVVSIVRQDAHVCCLTCESWIIQDTYIVGLISRVGIGQRTESAPPLFSRALIGGNPKLLGSGPPPSYAYKRHVSQGSPWLTELRKTGPISRGVDNGGNPPLPRRHYLAASPIPCPHRAAVVSHGVLLIVN